MILDLPNTTTSAISKEMVRIRDEGGANALGRVLTLLIVVDSSQAESAISAANDASREHPMRVIVLSTNKKSEGDGLDAQIRVGGDAGASEVIVLTPRGEAANYEEELVTGLLLPDAPLVTWWLGKAPETVADSDLGKLSQRRIIDSASQSETAKALLSLSSCYSPGDTDLAWTRLTHWRAQLAAVLDQPPYLPVERVEVSADPKSPSGILLKAWLALELQTEIVDYESAEQTENTGIHGVKLIRSNGAIEIKRIEQSLVQLSQPNQPDQFLNLAKRELNDCIAEELRRLDPDDLYGRVITVAVPQFFSKSQNLEPDEKEVESWR